jgi:hypothetical protein
MLALLRYEYNPSTAPKNAMLFGPRYDSQDAWIFHTNNTVSPENEKLFSFQLGKPGCDNKIVYLMHLLNFEVVNDPLCIRTYHYHTSQVRRYSAADALPMPLAGIIPADIPRTTIRDSLGMQMSQMRDMSFDDNTVLYEYVLNKLTKSQSFVIPRISTIETECAAAARMILRAETSPTMRKQLVDMLRSDKFQSVMKTNTGVKLSSDASIQKYSDAYLRAFENCDVFGAWDRNDNVFPCVTFSQPVIEHYIAPNKRAIWGFAFDIFHYIYHPTPWTHALRNKRVLLISAFESSIQEKLPIRDKIYGRELFPECTFITIRPPQTQGSESAAEFDIVLGEFFVRLDALKGQYDVALVSCGGYGSLVVNHIYESGGSAIYVGGVLQMYFGILGSRWLRERSDVVRLFLNEHWSRPKETERPNGHASIEKSCYW